MKHGMRVSPGGAFLSLGLEDTPGVPPPPEAMRSIAGSEFGSTFFQREQLDDASKFHFSMRRTTINWSATTLALRLGLIAMSISNIVSALLLESGVPPEEKQFHRPTPPDAFDRAWDPLGGPTHVAMDRFIAVPTEQLLAKEQLRGLLESRRTVSS